MRRCRLECAAVLSLAGILLAEGAAALWIDVPFIKQEKNGCGAASIAMVMQYWARQQGRPATAEANEIQRELYSGQAHGILASAVEEYFRRNEYQVFAFAGEWQDLQEQVRKGRPLMVALRPLGNGKERHYVVVVGVDEARHLVLVNDPAERKLLPFEREEFEKAWKVTDHWTLLAVPRDSR
jgi:ABC-type bacteriocin/lantibiotic exporter with double-glycine peptidase domain